MVCVGVELSGTRVVWGFGVAEEGEAVVDVVGGFGLEEVVFEVV